MTNKVENCLDFKEILPESLYLSGDMSGVARGFAGASRHPALQNAFLAPLGFTSIAAVFSGIAASNKGKEIALTAERCTDVTTMRMGQVQRVRGWTEMLCGVSFIPLRLSQSVKKLNLKMVYFKPLYFLGMTLVLLLYILLIIPIVYRICLFNNIRKQVAKMTPKEQLAHYQDQLKGPKEVKFEQICREVEKIPEASLKERNDKLLKSHPMASQVKTYFLEHIYLGFNFPSKIEQRVSMVLEEYDKQVTAGKNEQALRVMKFSHAVGPDAVKLIVESQKGKAVDVQKTIKKINYAKGLYVGMLALGVITAVIGIGIFAYSMDMGGLASIQNYGLMVVSGLFLICDTYGFIQDLKHLELKKEKAITLALTALLFTGALMAYLHHGHATSVSNAIFYSVLAGWAAQMVVLFSVALYKRMQEKSQKALHAAS
ncbi:MAG: hypothetical protein KBC64_05180 [Simkaniaceae bacterium]|nr:hypothetical protein [Simkaniaceae bacterium]